MTTARAPKLVAGELLAATALLGAGAVLFALNRATGRSDSIFSFADVFQELAPSIAFVLTGAALGARRPDNLVGKLCVALGLFGLLGWA
jgi:hypothetical protein